MCRNNGKTQNMGGTSDELIVNKTEIENAETSKLQKRRFPGLAKKTNTGNSEFAVILNNSSIVY